MIVTEKQLRNISIVTLIIFVLSLLIFLKISPFNQLISDYQSSEITKEDLQYLNCLKKFDTFALKIKSQSREYLDWLFLCFLL